MNPVCQTSCPPSQVSCQSPSSPVCDRASCMTCASLSHNPSSTPCLENLCWLRARDGQLPSGLPVWLHHVAQECVGTLHEVEESRGDAHLARACTALFVKLWRGCGWGALQQNPLHGGVECTGTPVQLFASIVEVFGCQHTDCTELDESPLHTTTMTTVAPLHRGCKVI